MSILINYVSEILQLVIFKRIIFRDGNVGMMEAWNDGFWGAIGTWLTVVREDSKLIFSMFRVDCCLKVGYS